MSESWPATVYIIRHGEKPGRGNQPPGFDERGRENVDSLTVRGWQRAAGLAVLFGGDPIARSPVRSPQLLVAPRYPHQAGSARHRSYETLQPLCHLLNIQGRTGGGDGVEIAADWQVDQHDHVVHQIRHSGVDTVLVAWEHHNIAAIASLLCGVPIEPWPGDRFDLIWRFTLVVPGSYTFEQLPQMLLVGDAGP